MSERLETAIENIIVDYMPTDCPTGWVDAATRDIIEAIVEAYPRIDTWQQPHPHFETIIKYWPISDYRDAGVPS